MNAGQDVSASQKRASEQRHILEKHPPFPPTLKALLHKLHGFPWWPVRPPLEALPDDLAEIVALEMKSFQTA
jgi:hypothetical protein